MALAGAALAQQPEEQATPKEKQAVEPAKPAKTHATPAKSGANAAQSQEATAKPEATAAKQHGATHERATSKALKTEATPKSGAATGTETNVSGEATASATPGAKQGAAERRKATRGAKASPSATAATKASPSATAAAAATASATPAKAASPITTATTAASPGATAATGATASVAPTVGAAGQTNAAAAAKKPDPQQVQQIKQQHANFKAQPKPQQVPAVTFNQSYRIEGSDRWQGPQYQVFRSYHPERHDQGWYRSHYPRVELIGGGYYYWNSGYWYPAWGYSPSYEDYAYDGPIYVGQRAQPPDQVIADVQAVLQQMGYYKGEVDGLLGPLTRQALTAYQADQGLTTTAAIDQPTLDSLGMG